MMSDSELIDWLIANGGPTIKYRTITELAVNTPIPDGLIDELLQVKRIDTLLHRLDSYEPLQTVNTRVLNTVHTGTGVEGIVSKLIELGLKAGIPEFDSRMQVFRQYVDNEFVKIALSGPAGQNSSYNQAVFIAVLIASFFVHAGYEYEEITSFITERINSLYKLASERQFNIHLSEAELTAFPKRPKCWSNNPVIRPEMDPMCSEKPLPLIHDIFCLAFMPQKYLNEELQRKIDEIIDYVMDVRFQELPRGYGLLYYKYKRSHYACGWRPELPCMNGFENEYDITILVLYTELMSCFRTARKTEWFKNCIKYLEQFKTDKGTYCFPPSYIKEAKDMGYVCGMSMGLGENRRSLKAYEIESTFRMLLIKKRCGLID